MKEILDYFSPHRRISRKVRWLQKFTRDKGFHIAATELSKMAKDFEKFERIEHTARKGGDRP